MNGKNLTAGRKRAVSTVVGAVFIGIIVFTSIAGFFAYQGSVNSSLQQVINERNQLDASAKAEAFLLTAWNKTGSTNLYVNVTNTGGVTIDIIDVAVQNSACNTLVNGPTSTGPGGIGINPGKSQSISTGYPLPASGTSECIEVITSLGNIGTTVFPPLSVTTIVTTTSFTQVSGTSNPLQVAVGWNFNSLKWYKYISCGGSNNVGGKVDAGYPATNPTNVCTLTPTAVATAPDIFTISAANWPGSNAVFSVNITNDDPQGRAVSLDSWTQLWFSTFNIGPGGGTANSAAYGLVNVTQSYNIALNSWVPTTPLTTVAGTPKITLNLGQSATLFFAVPAGAKNCPCNPQNTGSITPIFVLLHGTLGGGPNNLPTINYGENIPLAMTVWTS